MSDASPGVSLCFLRLKTHSMPRHAACAIPPEPHIARIPAGRQIRSFSGLDKPVYLYSIMNASNRYSGCSMEPKDRESADREPTGRDVLYLEKLRSYYKLHKRIPTMAALTEVVGLSSTSSVFALVGRLTEAGFLDRMPPDRRIVPGKKFFERPLLCYLRAGTPQEDSQDAPEGMAIDDYLIEYPNRTLLLRVKGDSMKDSGLVDGDIAVVLKGAPTEIGDMVVAVVDGQFTVKYLDRGRDRRYFLRPANEVHHAIYAQGTLEIFGLVVGSFRKHSRPGGCSA